RRIYLDWDGGPRQEYMTHVCCGNYSFNDLADSTYTLTYDYPWPHLNPTYIPSQIQTVTISEGENVTINFGTGTDTTAPVLVSSTPADDVTGVATDTNIVLVFDKAVDVGAGDITIHQASTGATVGTVSVTSWRVTGDGTATITVDPPGTLSSETGYYINVDPSAFQDTAGYSYGGIVNTSSLNFVTADVEPPLLVSSVPADGATGVHAETNITLMFDEAVHPRYGNITIHYADSGNVVETFTVPSGQVAGLGTDTITINPAQALFEVTTSDDRPLAAGTTFYINVDPQTLRDSAGNDYPGIDDSTTLS
ncbi:uncharacterized protein METZ01_LOCUS366032, partial [marine metagenome]